MFVCIIYTIKTIRKVNETEKVSHFVDMLVKKITMNDLFTASTVACYSHIFKFIRCFLFLSSRCWCCCYHGIPGVCFFFSLRAYAFGTHWFHRFQRFFPGFSAKRSEKKNNDIQTDPKVNKAIVYECVCTSLCWVGMFWHSVFHIYIFQHVESWELRVTIGAYLNSSGNSNQNPHRAWIGILRKLKISQDLFLLPHLISIDWNSTPATRNNWKKKNNFLWQK